ncbi:uncharacterized protein LOC128402568 isoform X2 [Podarcis raffonei]|uniref:uncharacterized protein LOC128402568 isoform X2 n=1 Tax=Podarcis raffonei TaxID=65483 RepID=UPI00232918CC|nr:uncharacterized protein LOC128402568 isoform X2 [Podarcis raffonei]
MAGSSGALIWLQKVRLSVEKSQEWEDFILALSDAVQQQMVESHINALQDLSEAAKGFVLEKAVSAIQGGDAYKALMSQVSGCLEEQIYCQIAQEIQDGDRRVKNKPALLLNHLKDGVVTLLEERPELRGRLCSLFNQPLPADLRHLTWKIYLSNTKARLGYLSHLAANRATSWKDREISLRCQALLDSELTFRSLKNHKVAAQCLRNVLSYYHKLQGTSTPLRDQDYFLPVPLLQVILDLGSSTSSVESVSALLVEEFMSLKKLHPQLVRLSISVQDPSRVSIVEEVASLLEQRDRDLARFLESVYAQPGYLNMDTLLYIWDQIILGLERPSYNCLPVFTTIFVLLLHGRLLTCQSPVELEATLKTWGPSLLVQEFQDMMEKHFFEDLYSQLLGGNKEPTPIHDPTQTFPPWRYRDFQAVPPPRTRPEDRRQTREERQLLEEQRLERTQQEERLQRFRAEEQKRLQEMRFLQLLEENKRKFEMQKVHLEDQLSQERQVRYEMQMKAEEQISRLQAEMQRLAVDRKMPSPDTYSAGSLLAPAPSLQSQTPSQTSLPHFCLSDTVAAHQKHKTADGDTIAFKLLKHMMEAASSIVNGSSTEERERLDVATREHIRDYNEDEKNAKIEMFGYEISEDEINNIPEARRKDVRKKLEQALRRGAEARYMAARGRGLPAFITHMDVL